MLTTRRTAIRRLLIMAGGVALIPSCMHSDNAKTSISLKNINLNRNDEKLLAELAETIIPQTDTPGAKDTYTHLYILKMMDDCSSKEDQRKFVKGLKAFEKFFSRTGQTFLELTPAQKEEAAYQIENKKDVPEEVLAFYNTVKSLTIQGYLTSKYYLSNVQVYELVPGRFKGCVNSQPLKGSKDSKPQA